jgi:hypothetical protein
MSAAEAMWAAFAEQVDRQIRGRSDYASITACLADPDMHRVMVMFDPDDGGLDILTCAWRVSVAVPDGWLTVATVSWRDLPVTLDDVRHEHAWALAQLGLSA